MIYLHAGRAKPTPIGVCHTDLGEPLLFSQGVGRGPEPNAIG